MQVLLKLTALALIATPLTAAQDKTPEKSAPVQVKAPEKVTPKRREFPSADGMVLTADLYSPNKLRNAPVIVLFHQARWSRGEYLEIAPLLCKMGFNCLAVDLRSGKAVNDVRNETAKRAEELDLPSEYIDALPDIEASLLYARKHLTQGKVIAWGSSYSASLVLHLAGTKPKLMDGVLSFAPGEYFKGKPKDWIASSVKDIRCPTFVTSSKEEAPNWEAIYKAIPEKFAHSFIPKTVGNHGSKALWKKFEDSEAYWKQVKPFLLKNIALKKTQSESK